MAISKAAPAAAGTHGPSSRRLIEADPEVFHRDFNQRPFRLHHSLVENPLMRMRRLIELARSLAQLPGEVYYDVGVNRVDQRWDETPRPAQTVDQIIADISAARAWIILRRAELDPDYRVLLDACMSELSELGFGPYRDRVRVRNAIVFITSPQRVTTYHIDRECNFILQIQGRKTVYIFDQNDREVLPEQELERFWAVDNNAAKYKAHYQDRARVFELEPGDGVHVPVNAPHWVRNGDGPSITLSVNFQFDDMLAANQYKANYYLRKLGLNPAPPGRSAIRDQIKANAIRGAILLRKPFKRLTDKR